MYVLRFIKNLKTRTFGPSDDPKFEKQLSAEEITYAEVKFLKIVQKHFFGEEFKYLTTKCGKIPQLVNQLGLFVDSDSLIRLQGRLSETGLSEDSKFPILLPANSVFTKNIIFSYHVKYLHAGVSELLSILRKRFWIIKARTRIRSTIRKCVSCLKVRGSPFDEPKTPPFPSDRVTKSRPFAVTGVDYTGAISLIENGKPVKNYIVLFTCAVTRAVHMEIAKDCSEHEFINCLVLFCSKHSIPSILHCDNASYFKAAKKTVEQILRNPLVTDYCNNHNITFKFLTPRAPWRGGMWERLIGVMKDTLKKVIGNALLSPRELQIVVSKIEAKMNDRPLTYVTDDHRDLQPLTPSMLLYGFRLTDFPMIVDVDEIRDPTYSCGNMLNLRFKRISMLSDHIWKRWHAEYLSILRERYNFNSKKSERGPKLGEVVLIHNENKRTFWSMGLVVRIFRGVEDEIMSAEVKTSSGILLRPVTKLYPLEVSSEVEDVKLPVIDGEIRPKRKAMIDALVKLKDC